ncbi:O-antigen ligase family protein [Kiloniella laminariae]|uniref:O-antigen ligase family protein n=1 Tax=Kiloniella laminariae TaxID=454162 RepID=A0ABT4LG73_9PROT|nr:O-antigen ligase family protein [Kiloniella laminariae]MCZ4279331.1 O-antigen ligase family protein [Kiloniella laminariae]
MNGPFLRLFFFLIPSLSVFSSNALVPLVGIVAVATTAIHFYETRELPRLSRLQLALLIGFFGWVGLSTVWAINPENSFLLSLRLLALTLGGLLLISAVEKQSAAVKKQYAKALLWGCILGAVLLLVESNLSAPLTKLAKGKTLDEAMNLSRFNRGASFLGIACWALFAIYSSSLPRLLRGILPLLPIGVLYFAPSESSLLAVILGGIWYLMFFLKPRLGFWLLPVLMTGSILLMPLIVQKVEPLYGPESSQSIPFSAKHRFFIWDFVGSQIIDHPLIGSGFDSARDYPNNGVENYVHTRPDGTTRALGGRIISLHPHNFALQVWLELGVIGVLLVCLIIWTLFVQLKKKGLDDDPAIQAMMVSLFIIALLGYGIWQNRWFVMFFIFAALVPLVTAAKQADKQDVKR